MSSLTIEPLDTTRRVKRSLNLSLGRIVSAAAGWAPIAARAFPVAAADDEANEADWQRLPSRHPQRRWAGTDAASGLAGDSDARP